MFIVATLTEIFKREFKTARANLPVNTSIYDLNLPQSSLPKGNFYVVDGITEDLYKDLNGQHVMLYPRQGGKPLERRRLNSEGEFMYDRQGNHRIDEIPCPKGYVAVVSRFALTLPYEAERNGYNYVDYFDLPESEANGLKSSKAKADIELYDLFGYGEEENSSADVVEGEEPLIRHFIYVLPKSVLYKVHFNALAVSSKTMKAYEGISVKTWTSGVLHICVIPYKAGNTYANTVILDVKPSLDFEEEVSELLGYLVQHGIMSDPYEYLTDEGENLGISEVVPAYDKFEYQSKDLYSLDNVAEQEFEEVFGKEQ